MMVADACQAIERHYFPTTDEAPKPKGKAQKGK